MCGVSHGGDLIDDIPLLRLRVLHGVNNVFRHCLKFAYFVEIEIFFAKSVIKSKK